METTRRTSDVLIDEFMRVNPKNIGETDYRSDWCLLMNVVEAVNESHFYNLTITKNKVILEFSEPVRREAAKKLMVTKGSISPITSTHGTNMKKNVYDVLVTVAKLYKTAKVTEDFVSWLKENQPGMIRINRNN